MGNEELHSHSWYHTFELPDGVVTQGLFDLRSVAKKVPIPASLDGKRCLDAAASDGFWSFELARRGAKEVVSLDLDDTTRQDIQGVDTSGNPRAGDQGRAAKAFHLVRDALGADNVRRVDMNVYDASPERLGTFDYVFMGAILLHLSDPAKAVRAIRSVTNPDGEFLSVETVSLPLTLLSRRRPLASLSTRDDFPRWWTPNMAGHRRLLQSGGFDVVDAGGPVFERFGSWRPRVPRSIPSGAEWHYWLWTRPFGLTSAWARCRPTP